MRLTLALFYATFFLLSCGSNKQSKAIEDQKKANEVLASLESKSTLPRAGEWVMTAKIDGKPWAATSFKSPDETDYIWGDYKDESIKLPYYRQYMAVGYKSVFGDNRTAQLFLSDEVDFWIGEKGEVEITKVDGQMVEGKFFFTGTSTTTDRKIEVTDGFFRIFMSK